MSPKVKFTVGGLVILLAVVFLVFSSMQANAEYFYTVDELKAKGAGATGQNIRISGAVIGDTISYDAQTSTLRFTVAHVPGDNAEVEKEGGLAEVLHQAVIDTGRARLQVVYKGVKPDLLRNEAQAIMTGHLGPDGVFYVDPDQLLLKCPTKYEQAVPQQAQGN